MIKRRISVTEIKDGWSSFYVTMSRPQETEVIKIHVTYIFQTTVTTTNNNNNLKYLKE